MTDFLFDTILSFAMTLFVIYVICGIFGISVLHYFFVFSGIIFTVSCWTLIYFLIQFYKRSLE